MKRTGFPYGQPDSLYHRDSPWISRYHIQNTSQEVIIVILSIHCIQGFNYYIIQWTCSTRLPLQARWVNAKQTESGTITRPQVNFILGHLHHRHP